MSFLITIFVLMIIFSLVEKGSKKELLKNKGNDAFIVRAPKLYVWISIIATVFISTAATAAFIYDEDSKGFWSVIIFGIILFCAACANSTLARTVRINVKDDFFEYRTFFWRIYHIRYSDIQEVRLGKNWLSFKLDSKRFFVETSNYNFELFIEMLESKKVSVINTHK